jgi:regulator of protease activity HflC (stomatin/prohibitin superfamily)
MKIKPMIVVATLSLILSACSTVSLQEVGLKVSKAGSERGISQSNIVNGYVAYNPLTTNIVTYPRTVQGVTWGGADAITFRTQKGLRVTAPVGFNFRVDPAKAANIYVLYGSDVNKTMNDNIKKIVQKIMNDVGSQYTPEQLVGAGGPVFEEKVAADLKDRLGQIGFIVENFSLTEGVHPPESIANAITQTQQAAQNALRVQAELASTKAEAQKNIAEAEGQAKAKIAAAQGEAQSRLLRAEADAKANKLLANSLTPELVQYQKVQKWNGQNPTTVLGDGQSTLVTVK